MGGGLIGEKDMCGNTSKELEVCNLNIFPPLDFPASNILQHLFFEFTTNTTIPSNQIDRIDFYVARDSNMPEEQVIKA